jgi:hypothetical protein
MYTATRYVPRICIDREYGRVELSYGIGDIRQIKTFATRKAAWRYVVWGMVFRARSRSESCDHGPSFSAGRCECPLCHDAIIKQRVHRIATRLAQRDARRS